MPSTPPPQTPPAEVAILLYMAISLTYCSVILILEITHLSIQIPLRVWRWYLHRHGRELPLEAAEALRWAVHLQAVSWRIQPLELCRPLDRVLVPLLSRVWHWLRMPLWIALGGAVMRLTAALCVWPIDMAGEWCREVWRQWREHREERAEEIRRRQENSPPPPPRIDAADRVVSVGGRLVLDRGTHSDTGEDSGRPPGGG
jgi:hypothetical protein